MECVFLAFFSLWTGRVLFGEVFSLTVNKGLPFLTDHAVAMETLGSINVTSSNRQECGIGLCLCVCCDSIVKPRCG